MNKRVNPGLAARTVWLALSLVGAPLWAAEPAAVQVGAVELREVVPAFWAAGSVVSRFDSQIAAEINGRAVWSAELGSSVAAGEPLLRLDDRDYQLATRLDRAEIGRIKAQLEYLAKQRSRLGELRQRDSSSQDALDKLNADSASLAEQLTAAEVALAQSELALARTTVLAPFSGVVAERAIELGEYVSRGQPVARLVSTSQLEASVRAPLATLRNTAPGSEVLVAAADREQLAAVVQMVAVADPVSRLVEVRLALASERGWVVGEPLRAALAQGELSMALTVPRDAVVLREGEAYLMRINGTDSVVKVPVKLGFGQRGFVAVEPLDGQRLAAGDAVVVRGAERLRSGQSVSVLSRPVVSP